MPLLSSCCSSVAAISSQDDLLSSSSLVRDKLIKAIAEASSNHSNHSKSIHSRNNKHHKQSPLATLEQWLLRHPPDVLLIPNRAGNTPLHQVCRWRPLPRYEVMHLLVTRAPPGALAYTNQAQQTPLHWLVAAVLSSHSVRYHHHDHRDGPGRFRGLGTPRWTFHQSSSSYHNHNHNTTTTTTSWHTHSTNHNSSNHHHYYYYNNNDNNSGDNHQHHQQQQQQLLFSDLQQIPPNHHPVTALIHLFLQYSGGNSNHNHHNHTRLINAASIADVNGLTPLHVACCCSSSSTMTTATSAIHRDWIQRLIRAYPPAVSWPSRHHGSTPLHYASAAWTVWSSTSAAAVPVLDLLVREYPLACLRSNRKGWWPVEEVAAAARQPLWSVALLPTTSTSTASSYSSSHHSLQHPVLRYMTQVTMEAVQALMDTLSHVSSFQAAPTMDATTTTSRNMIILQQQLQSWYTSALLTQSLDLPALKQLLVQDDYQDILQPLLWFGPLENDDNDDTELHLHYHDRDHCDSPRSLHWLFVALFRMNRVGRLDYLAHDPSNRVRGVHVLAEIPHLLDGLWVHVRENPALCDPRSRMRTIDPPALAS